MALSLASLSMPKFNVRHTVRVMFVFLLIDIEDIPSSSSNEYREDAERHVSRTNDQPTPFISVHKNLMRVLHYAFQNKRSSVAVVDLQSLEHIEHVQPLKLLPPGDYYRGIGEYLVYGEIRKQSLIHVISLRDFLDRVSVIPDDLFGMRFLRTSSSTDKSRRRIKETLSPLDLDTGRSVGSLLQILKIPSHFIESAIGTVVDDWQFPGHKQWRENSRFLKGVNERCVDLRNPVILKLANLTRSEKWYHDFIKDLREATTLEYCSEKASRTEVSASFIEGYETDYEESNLEESIDFINELHEAAKSSYIWGNASFIEGSARFVSNSEKRFEDSNMEESTDFMNELRKAARLENKTEMESTSGSLSSLEEIEDAEMELEGVSGLEDELQDVEEILQKESNDTEMLENKASSGAKIPLVEYSDSEENGEEPYFAWL